MAFTKVKVSTPADITCMTLSSDRSCCLCSQCRDTSGGLLAIVVNLDGRFVRHDQFVRQLAPCIAGQEVKISLTCHKPRYATDYVTVQIVSTSSTAAVHMHITMQFHDIDLKDSRAFIAPVNW